MLEKKKLHLKGVFILHMQDIKLFKSKCTFRNSFILIIVLKNFVGKVRADVHMVHTD